VERPTVKVQLAVTLLLACWEQEQLIAQAMAEPPLRAAALYKPGRTWPSSAKHDTHYRTAPVMYAWRKGSGEGVCTA